MKGETEKREQNLNIKFFLNFPLFTVLWYWCHLSFMLKVKNLVFIRYLTTQNEGCLKGQLNSTVDVSLKEASKEQSDMSF